jgi:hypothetical protein
LSRHIEADVAGIRVIVTIYVHDLAPPDPVWIVETWEGRFVPFAPGETWTLPVPDIHHVVVRLPDGTVIPMDHVLRVLRR